MSNQPEALSLDTPLSFSDLARWGLAEQALRERVIDQLLVDQPMPAEESLQGLRQALIQRLGLADEAALEHWLSRYQLSAEAFDGLAARPWQWLQWCRQHWGDQVQSLFLRRKPQLDQVTYSMLRMRDGGLASELYLQIKEGEASFADLATAFSEGEEKRTGGLMGPMPLTQPHPALARLLQISQPGQLWPPRALDGWWVVVRLEQLLAAQLDGPMVERLLLDQGEEALRQMVMRPSPATAAVPVE